MREFWLRLVPDFEELEICKEIRNELSGVEQRVRVLDEACSALLLEVETERNRTQLYMNIVQDKTREVEELMAALRDDDDERRQERDQQDVLVARLRAAVRCQFYATVFILIEEMT